MEAGEKELKKAFEETSTRNIKAILEHSNETRKLTRNLEEKVTKLEEIIIIQNNTIEELRKLLVNVQVKMYSGGTQ